MHHVTVIHSVQNIKLKTYAKDLLVCEFRMLLPISIGNVFKKKTKTKNQKIQVTKLNAF